MDIKITIDMDDFFERWGEESLATCIKDEVRAEVLRVVKQTPQYKDTVRKQQEEMMRKLIDG